MPDATMIDIRRLARETVAELNRIFPPHTDWRIQSVPSNTVARIVRTSGEGGDADYDVRLTISQADHRNRDAGKVAVYADPHTKDGTRDPRADSGLVDDRPQIGATHRKGGAWVARQIASRLLSDAIEWCARSKARVQTEIERRDGEALTISRIRKALELGPPDPKDSRPGVLLLGRHRVEVTGHDSVDVELRGLTAAQAESVLVELGLANQ